PPHQTEAWATFVAKLGLNMVEVDGQLPPAVEFVAGNVGNDFFGSRLQNEIPFVSVLNAQQFRAISVPATRFFPELGGLYDGHQQFDGAGPVHFLAYDGFYFPDYTQTQWHVCVDAGRSLPYHAGAQHQLVADDFRIRGCFFESVDVVLAGVHGEVLCRYV